MFFSPFFPSLTNFLFFFILTITSRTAFTSGGASSFPYFVPDLKKNKDSSLNRMFHVGFCYTGILCSPRLLGGWIQMVGGRARWSQLIGYIWFMNFGQWVVTEDSEENWKLNIYLNWFCYWLSAVDVQLSSGGTVSLYSLYQLKEVLFHFF